MKIRQPRFDQSHPDYVHECEETLEGSVRELLDLAIQSGWAPTVVLEALSGIVEHQHLAYAEDPDPADD